MKVVLIYGLLISGFASANVEVVGSWKLSNITCAKTGKLRGNGVNLAKKIKTVLTIQEDGNCSYVMSIPKAPLRPKTTLSEFGRCTVENSMLTRTIVMIDSESDGETEVMTPVDEGVEEEFEEKVVVLKIAVQNNKLQLMEAMTEEGYVCHKGDTLVSEFTKIR